MQFGKVKVGIIGTGNVGTDILMKVSRSKILECGMFSGRRSDSPGIKIAKEMGIRTSVKSIKAIQDDPCCCDIVFDATSARVHRVNAPILKDLGKFTIDLTPSNIGKMCIPVLNLDQCLSADNVNLITCGGQAAIPIAYAISKVHPEIAYIEVVATISSKSAGMGTRNNIDEFTQTTKDALSIFSGVRHSKAIIILNPADPPITMQNTVYAIIKSPNMDIIRKSVRNMEERIRKYVPGYRVIMEPTYENGRVTTILQVEGQGDYLPRYSGNLDIISCAAIEVAERYAMERAKKKNEPGNKTF